MKIVVFVLLCLFCPIISSVDLIIWGEYDNSILLDRFAIQRIFTRKIIRWPNGQYINVFIKPIHSIEHRDFVKTVLQITPYYFEQQLEEQTYTGRSTSVTEVPNDQQMLVKISSTPGAIGYINYEIYIDNKRVFIIDPSVL